MKNYFELLNNYKFITLLSAGILEVYRRMWLENIRGSYSQNYEDLIIEKILNKKKGTYLEIGGYHPTRLSNTYRFYKKGWRGTIVEPNPEVKNLFERSRPEDKFINVGVSNKNIEMNYYCFLIPALNTFSKIEANRNVEEGHKLVEVTKIKTIKIKEIVSKRIDLLSLDTEGFDEMILKSWPWAKCQPKVICVENTSEDVLLANGYELIIRTKFNSIYIYK